MNADKQAIFEEAKALLDEWYPDIPREDGCCLYWNQVAMRTLLVHGYKPVMQAGSMHWKINHNPDPNVADTFGYEWSPDTHLSQSQIYNGLLPEVHIWAALPETGELIDFSTGSIKAVATERFGFIWDREDPPEFVWGAPPPGTVYMPNRQAIAFVWRFIMRIQGITEDCHGRIYV